FVAGPPGGVGAAGFPEGQRAAALDLAVGLADHHLARVVMVGDGPCETGGGADRDLGAEVRVVAGGGLGATAVDVQLLSGEVEGLAAVGVAADEPVAIGVVEVGGVAGGVADLLEAP